MFKQIKLLKNSNNNINNKKKVKVKVYNQNHPKFKDKISFLKYKPTQKNNKILKM